MLGEEGNGEQVNATLEYAWLETWGGKLYTSLNISNSFLINLDL